MTRKYKFFLSFILFSNSTLFSTYNLFSFEQMPQMFCAKLLFNAAEKHDLDLIVEAIERFKVNPLERNDDGLTAMHLVVKDGFFGKDVERIIKYLTNIQPRLLDAQDLSGRTPLHMAVLCRNLSLIECLLKCGANPDILNDNGHTPLYIAVDLNCVYISETLLFYGANLFVSSSVNSPLLHAHKLNRSEILSLFGKAILENHLEKVRNLINDQGEPAHEYKASEQLTLIADSL